MAKQNVNMEGLAQGGAVGATSNKNPDRLELSTWGGDFKVKDG